MVPGLTGSEFGTFRPHMGKPAGTPTRQLLRERRSRAEASRCHLSGST
jgi:hypothetical protein